jgi:hypothetical protein
MNNLTSTQLVVASATSVSIARQALEKGDVKFADSVLQDLEATLHQFFQQGDARRQTR